MPRTGRHSQNTRASTRLAASTRWPARPARGTSRVQRRLNHGAGHDRVLDREQQQQRGVGGDRERPGEMGALVDPLGHAEADEEAQPSRPAPQGRTRTPRARSQDRARAEAETAGTGPRRPGDVKTGQAVAGCRIRHMPDAKDRPPAGPSGELPAARAPSGPGGRPPGRARVNYRGAQPVLGHPGRDLGPGADLQLAPDVLHVRLRRPRRDGQPLAMAWLVSPSATSPATWSSRLVSG